MGSSGIKKVYDYDAYGNQLSSQTGDDNPYRYCGEYYDEETGLIYLRARYYSPETGRFISQDPAKDGINWYAYCNNNPLAFVDRNGLWPTWGQILSAVATVAVAAVVVAAVVSSAGTAGAAIGLGLTMAVGGSGATAATLTTIATWGCYAVAGTVGAFAVSDVTETFTGTNPIRDGLMDGNQQAYDLSKTLVYGCSAAITTLAVDNQGLKNLYPSKKDIKPKTVYESASAEFREKETQAGHAIQKHSQRSPEIWGKINGNTDRINKTGMKHIREIMSADGEFKLVKSGNVYFWEKYLPDKRGLRLNLDGTFKGFVEKGYKW